MSVSVRNLSKNVTPNEGDNMFVTYQRPLFLVSRGYVWNFGRKFDC